MINEFSLTVGDPLIECEYCGAKMWYQERMGKTRHSVNPKYQLCCGNGKVQLPLLKSPPPFLQHLLFDRDSSVSKKFQQNIRAYNMMFAFTSSGAKLDKKFNNSRGPPTIRMHGQSCHKIGSLLPMPGQSPKFAQLYIYDTKNEIQNRLHWLRYAHMPVYHIINLYFI
jgi:DNA-directed RNA polymerase subunit RPC12/RpoP